VQGLGAIVLRKVGEKMRKQIQDFVHCGYALLDDVFSLDVVSTWRDLFENLRGADTESVYTTVSWFRNMVERFPEQTVAPLLNPVLIDFMESILGPFVQLDGMSLVGFAPVDDTTIIRGWHRDRYASFPSGVYNTPRAVHVLCYLQPIDRDEHGPLRVVPGSHIAPIHVLPEEERCHRNDEVLIYPKPGQAVVLHNMLLHSGTLHRTEELRCFASICFNHSSMKQSDIFRGPKLQQYLRMSRVAEAPRRARLFGQESDIGPGVNRMNCGFLMPDKFYWDKWFAEDRQNSQLAKEFCVCEGDRE
jgi:hypothetical protein